MLHQKCDVLSVFSQFTSFNFYSKHHPDFIDEEKGNTACD